MTINKTITISKNTSYKCNSIITTNTITITMSMYITITISISHY